MASYKSYKLFIFSALTITLSLIYNVSIATVWRVNNQYPTIKSQGIFSQLSPLNEDPDVMPGDTIHVEGSPHLYESFTSTKQLVIIGPGYFLTENPETQANALEARIHNLRFNQGAEGSIVMGLVFNYSSTSGIFVNTNNITIQRCYLRGSITITNQSGVRILQNYINGSVGGYSSASIFSDVIVKNNLFIGGRFNTRNGNFSICENNIFTGSNITINAVSFRNNIVLDNNAEISITSGNIQNNLTTNGQLGTENGNLSINPNSLFIEDGSTDGQYQLAQNSPAKGAGFEKVDAGAFGGESSYKLSGLAPIPSIYDLRIDDAGNLDNGIGVQIKVKSNQ